MPNLTISQLPPVTSGSPQSIMVIVSYDLSVTGDTCSIPFSALTKQFSGYYTVSAVTTSTTLTWTSNYYGVSGATALTVTLPSTTGKDGYTLTIKDESGSCSTKNITINAGVGNLIDGQSSLIMSTNYMSISLIVRNNNWYII